MYNLDTSPSILMSWSYCFQIQGENFSAHGRDWEGILPLRGCLGGHTNQYRPLPLPDALSPKSKIQNFHKGGVLRATEGWTGSGGIVTVMGGNGSGVGWLVDVD